MFENLTESLQKVFKDLRGHGKLTEKNVKDALREVRLALLEADVNYKTAKDFIKRVRKQSTGEEVLNSITPGQQVIKRVHSELIDLLGGETHKWEPSNKPAGIVLLGLHGAGKTTNAAKLARHWQKKNKKVLLVACDIRRPAAVDQLCTLADQVGCEVVEPREGESVPEIGSRARRYAIENGHDIVIYDTGGRFQIDEDLVGEIKDLRTAVEPEDVVLVIDAAIGQESVNIAEKFNEAVNLTGLMLTKLDGDARGGAALSVQAVTGCPILMVSVGEKPEDLEVFHPERMASRILGMGDVVSLVEKAEEAFDEDEAQKMQEKLQKNSFDLNDFLEQFQQMKKMGPLENLIKMMPGANKLPDSVLENSTKDSQRAEAIIQSMTPKERTRPKIINASRKSRIARGSGTHVRDVNELLKRFKQSKKMMKEMRKGQKGLPKMPF